MAKRIFRAVALTAFLSVLLCALLLVPTLYRVYEDQALQELRTEAALLSRLLEAQADDPAALSAVALPDRVTLIAPDGQVRYDSAAGAEALENHAQRPEFQQALATGSGISRRYSDTLSETTIYYALRTSSGAVVRLAASRSSVAGMFLKAAPLLGLMIAGVLVLSLVIARIAARRIVAPMNALNLDAPLENDAYDELAPLLTRMEHQHAQIRQQLQSLEKARGELAAVLENMQEGMVMVDGQGMVLSMNRSAGEIFGVNAAERTGNSLLALCRDGNVQSAVDAAQQGQYGSALLQRKDRAYRLFASPVLRDGRQSGVVLLLLDATASCAAEESRREFTANVSHELKTPLTAISGFAEIIRDGIAQPADVPAFAGKIYQESQRMIALVNDILELSRLDERQGLGEKETVDLAPLLRELAADFAPRAAEKQLALTLNAAGPLPVSGYPGLLREMFSNLIDNAVKYTLPGGQIAVDGAATQGGVVCSVSDNGIGIPKAHQAHVFERFYRVDKSHSRQTGGTGLGLAIVKHVARVHGAELTLRSQEPQDAPFVTRFILRFPPAKNKKETAEN